MPVQTCKAQRFLTCLNVERCSSCEVCLSYRAPTLFTMDPQMIQDKPLDQDLNKGALILLCWHPNKTIRAVRTDLRQTYKSIQVIQKAWNNEKSFKSKKQAWSLAWGSFHRAKVFPTSWIRPTSWNQSEVSVREIKLFISLINLTFSTRCRGPLSGCSWRMPSAVWKAWKELGKSTSGSDSSTSWSRDLRASIIPIWVWLNWVHSEDCREMAQYDTGCLDIYF